MKDKDSMLLENLYLNIQEARKPITDPSSIIGHVVEIHPAIEGTPDSNPLYMAWSIKLNGKVVGTAVNLLLSDCVGTIPHTDVNKKQRSSEDGRKTPNILVKGKVVDVNFPSEKLNGLISSGGWESVTYNPHKHTEYVYKDKLPEWWNTDKRFFDNTQGFKERRHQAMIERQKENFPFRELSKMGEGNVSSFKSDYVLLKQYLKRGQEDYMWVKGLRD